MKKLKKLKKGIKEIFKDIVNNGDEVLAGTWQGTDDMKDQVMLVLRNYDFSFSCPLTEDTLLEKTKADNEWVRLHMSERLSRQPTNPGKSYIIWPYANFKAGDKFIKQDKFSHTYQERFWPRFAHQEKANSGERVDFESFKSGRGIRFELGDLNDLIITLNSNKLTRQAFLPIFFPEDTYAASINERVPCTLGYLFYMSKGKLNVNYYIRSCDGYRHLRNDIYFTARLLQVVAEHIKEEVGEVNFYCANLHVFKNDLYNLKKRENYLK